MRTHPVPIPDAELTPGTRPAQRLRLLGFRYLHVIDAVSLYLLMVLITTVRFGLDWPSFPRSYYIVGFAVATAIHLTVYYFGGLYEYEQRLGRPPWLPRASVLTLIAVLADASVALLADRYLMPRANLIVLLVAGSLLVTFNRWVARSLRSRRFGQPRILLVGAPDDIELARTHIVESESTGTVVGQTGRASEILGQVDEVGATDVLLLSGGSLEDLYPQPLGVLEHRLIGVYRRITPADTLLGLQRSRQIGGMPFVALRAQAVPKCRLRFKRVLDLIYLVVSAPFVVPLAALVSLYVRIRAGRGVLFRQERVGRYGKTFLMFKFRTMHHNAEEATGAILAGKDDPRVVPGLGWLRKTRLDELPQFWNVIRGEMSLVGPRPERPEFVATYEQVIPGYGRRHDIPPGVTGLAQIRGHYQTDPGYKLGHDLQYVVNWSPIYDLEIMALTVFTMLRPRGSLTSTAAEVARQPKVSVVIPARDAASTIDECLGAVLAQDYAGEVDVVVAVGPSADATREIVERLTGEDSRVRLVDNPEGLTAAGLNRAVATSDGKVIARVDAQAVIPQGYLRRAVESMERTGAANVGGIQHPIGRAGLQRVIAVAMASPFGAGPARFRRDGYEGPADTVYLGVFDRIALEEVGGFDEEMVRNQDYDLNWRLREAGHVVWLDPELVVDYAPRATIRGLASQYYQYGTWKRKMLRRHPRSIQPRQVVAPLLVIGLAISAFELIRGRVRGLLLPLAYVNSSLLVAHDARAELPTRADRWRMVGVFATMHLAWGTGFLLGRVKRTSAAG